MLTFVLGPIKDSVSVFSKESMSLLGCAGLCSTAATFAPVCPPLSVLLPAAHHEPLNQVGQSHFPIPEALNNDSGQEYWRRCILWPNNDDGSCLGIFCALLVH